MVKNNKYYKDYIEKLIKINPSKIEITRMNSVSNGYGGYIKTPEKIELIVAFYERKANTEVLTTEGVTYRGSVVTKILTTGDADIKEYDKFTYKNKQYRVVFIRDYFDICKQCEVEVIKDEGYEYS